MFETYTLKGTIRLGKVFGVPFRLHYTWFIVVVLITAEMAITLNGIYTLWQNILLGIVASLLFFGSMCGRALAQESVAIGLHSPVKSVTLHFFGGVPRISDKDTRPFSEVLIALAGIVSSFIIAGIFQAANYFFARFDASGVDEVVRWLVFFNTTVAFFNFIPGFPLDVGRILRTIIWMINDDYIKATRIATLIGRILGYALIAGGILWAIITKTYFIGPVVSFAGMFLENAAITSRRQTQVREVLHGATARYMMTEQYTPIKQQFTIRAAREYVKNSGQNIFVVLEEGTLLGIVTLRNMRVDKDRWDTSTIGEVMTPISKIKSASPGQSVIDLLEQMEDYDIKQIPVLEQGKLLGLVSSEKVLRFLRTRSKLEE